LQLKDAPSGLSKKGAGRQPSALFRLATNLRLIVNVHVRVRELLYGGKRLLGWFMGFKPHCDRFDVVSVCANRGGLVIRKLISGA